MGSESYYLVKSYENANITTDPATLNGCKIGVLDSAMVDVLNKYLDNHRVKADVVAYSDYTQLFDAFDSHEVDILAAESDGAHGREHSEVLTVFGTSDYYLCVSKNRTDLLSELNSAQALLAAEEPNYLNSLRAKYYSVSVTARAFSKAETEWMDNHDSLHARCFGVEIGNEGLLKLLNRGINVLGDDYAQGISYRYTGGLYSYSFIDALRDHMALVGTGILIIAVIIVFLLIRDIRRTKKEVEEKENARINLEAKNNELAESQKALSDALIVAEHANRAKTAFLNNMSHDIRTPMNAIVGFTALAASHIDNKEQVQDYLGKISVSSQHLLSLINDVLDMSRIESVKVIIEETDVHLPDVIHDLRTIIQSNISSKQLELFIDTQDVKHEDIITDKLRLNQVLLNILSNAIKFTPAGGTISFRVIEKPSPADNIANFEFCIKDNGIGMSEEFQKTIFEAFSREKNKYRQRYSGYRSGHGNCEEYSRHDGWCNHSTFHRRKRQRIYRGTSVQNQ